MNQSRSFSRSYRLSRLLVHVAYAVALVLLLFPWVSSRAKVRFEKRWNSVLIRIMNVHIRLAGEGPDLSAQNVMLVANHVSWLDIYVLNAVRPAIFVSKLEVLSWPVVGWLAKKTGTLFIDRSKRHDTARVNNEVALVLKNGGCVAIFPEGTTSDGTYLRPFHASLLQPAIYSQSLVWPVSIRYTYADGSLNMAPAYIDELTFADSLKLILSQAIIYVEVKFMPPIEAHGKTRRELARDAQHAIAGALNLSVAEHAHAVSNVIVPC